MKLESEKMKVVATFITRDGFRRRETLGALAPHYRFARPAKARIACMAIPDPDKPPTGFSFEQVEFWLESHEKGAGNVIYAVYRER